MSERKRDQRQYDLIQQYLPGLILNTILKMVNDLGDPYTAKPGLGGMIAYLPRAMATVCIAMKAKRKTYRKMVGHAQTASVRHGSAFQAAIFGDFTAWWSTCV